MGDKYDSLKLGNQICFPLYATSRFITKLYTPLLKELDITYPQYLVLLSLWENEQLTVRAISEILFLESNTLTPLLKRMEKKGILIRKRSDEDERVVEVILTEKGWSIRDKAVCIPQQIVDSLSSSNLSREDIVHFKKTLDQLLPEVRQKAENIT
ncbi:MarR family winged helix-turn-helix transcriptional regulator [Salibacter halophilus]|uniref:HTH-type transcriptional regulator SarZ n=1 Tax=Salibacter halophilus TaxID=1803916 RepID=A0A6N6M804_9FLAO|nr:MarR family transcriptional regulator [Salibacter halophilus]KAB1064881.1 MarR family transcriptional regulator [Salibacter halophilus]